MSFRQEKAINELVAKGGSIAAAMRKGGYSPRTARNPKKLTGTKLYRERVIPILERYRVLREKIMNTLERRDLDYEATYDLNNLLKTIDGAINILEGRGGIQINFTFNAEKFNRFIERRYKQLASGSKGASD